MSTRKGKVNKTELESSSCAGRKGKTSSKIQLSKKKKELRSGGRKKQDVTQIENDENVDTTAGCKISVDKYQNDIGHVVSKQNQKDANSGKALNESVKDENSITQNIQRETYICQRLRM